MLKLMNSGKSRVADKYDAITRSQAVIEFTPDGKILTANQNFLDAMGYALNEIVGQSHSLFVDGEYAASREYREFWDALRAGQFQSAEYSGSARAGVRSGSRQATIPSRMLRAAHIGWSSSRPMSPSGN